MMYMMTNQQIVHRHTICQTIPQAQEHYQIMYVDLLNQKTICTSAVNLLVLMNKFYLICPMVSSQIQFIYYCFIGFNVLVMYYKFWN